MTLETQEPITTIEPILGLGADYEPEIVWWCLIYPGEPGYATQALATGVTSVFPSEQDATLYDNTNPPRSHVTQTTLADAMRECRNCNIHTMHLKDGGGNILKTWPV